MNTILQNGASASTLLNMDEVKVDPMVALRVQPNLAKRREMLPFILWQEKVHVACANPLDLATLGAFQRQFEKPLVAVAAETQSLRRALQRIYGNLNGGGTVPVLGKPVTASDPNRNGVPVAGEMYDASALSDEILYSAILRQASDIHLDPGPDYLRLRFRVDGALEEIQKLPSAVASALTNRFKVLSNMDISEKRAPQDGGLRHTYGVDNRTIDIRAATLPTKWGERMTLRLLGLQTGTLTLERLGMGPAHLAEFEKALAQPHGLILLTGPTGSGKSTTLYAGIRCLLGMEALNIITLEDPIEYDIAGVAQVMVDGGDKTTFNKALRSVLRHDPDVVMIGEIRDGETADIAVKASLTGHLVFSSLHTNSAPGAVTRMADMGVERYLIASTLRLSIAQRLVRRLCSHCRVADKLTLTEALSFNRAELAGTPAFREGGCLYCGGKGFSGRLGLFEFLSLDETWSNTIASGAQEADLFKEMKVRNLPTLLDDAMLKITSGQSSPEQVRTAVAAW